MGVPLFIWLVLAQKEYGFAVLVLAIAGGVVAAVVTSSDDDSGTPSAAPAPGVSSAPLSPAPSTDPGPSTSPSPTPSAIPSLPTTLVPTPAGLRAIGYRAYSLQEQPASAVAIDEDELARRREAWVPTERPARRGVLAKYTKLVRSANVGAVCS